MARKAVHFAMTSFFLGVNIPVENKVFFLERHNKIIFNTNNKKHSAFSWRVAGTKYLSN